MKKKILGSIAIVVIISVATFNVTLLTNSENNRDMSLKQLESKASGDSEEELRTYACDGVPNTYISRCEFSLSGTCNYNQQTYCSDGNNNPSGNYNTALCQQFGHFGNPCFRCGYGKGENIPTKNPHSWKMIQDQHYKNAYGQEIYLFQCTACKVYQESAFTPEPGTSCHP